MRFIYAILTVINLHLCNVRGQISFQSCPSDGTVNNGCPTGWMSYLNNCYQISTSTAPSYVSAKSICNKNGANLIRIQSKVEHQFFSDLLNSNAVNKSIKWYTAGVLDLITLNRFTWDGYPTALTIFNTELKSLFIELPNLNDINGWPKERSRVSYRYNNSLWLLEISTGDESGYFICQGSKALLSKIVPMQRSADFGQNLASIQRGPCIVNQPTDVPYVPMVQTSKLVTFSCDVYGNPFPTISWWFTIDTAQGPVRTQINPLTYSSGKVTQTGGLLTINDPDNSFDNKIECQATNQYGTVTSKPVQIQRGRLELYNKNARQMKRVADNTGFLLDCEAPEHSPADSIVYTFYITRTNDKGEIIDDVIQSQLRINVFLSFNLGLIGFSIASAKDSGTYKCMIGWKDMTGTSYKSPDIPLEVYPSNTLYPTPLVNDKFPNFRPSNPFLGDTVDFECFGYGEIKQNPLKYIWSWEGKDLPAKAVKSDFDRRVRMANIQFEDQGKYGCRIETYDGRVSDTKTITLKINAKPTFIEKPKNQYPDIGSNVTFSCQAIGKPAVTILWYKDDKLLGDWLNSNPNYKTRFNYVDGNVTLATLTISSVMTNDNGMYGCAVSNTYGKDNAFVELRTAAFAPSFDKYPLFNTEAVAGSNAILSCQAEGAPAPTITWKLNDGVLSPGESTYDASTGTMGCSGHLCTLPNKNLFIKNVVSSDIGKYTCTATNSLGSISTSAYLDVIPSLQISNAPVGRRVEVNSNVYLPCQASGIPYLDVDYDWYFENVRIKFDRMDLDARRYDKSQFWRPYYRYFGTLIISNIQFYDEANYTCRITTPFSSVDMSALIQVIGPPGVGGGITISSAIGNNSNTVQWTDGNNHGSDILWYKLEVAREDGLSKWYSLVDRINLTDITRAPQSGGLIRNSYTFGGLPANTNFRLRIYAANIFGLGQPSSQSEVFKTAAIPPVKIPQNVTGGGGKVGTLVVRWEPLNPLDENGDNFGYDIQYKETKELEWVAVTNFINKSLENGKYLQVTIDLPLNKDYLPYDVQVRAKNIKGPGLWSPISSITSASKLPSYAPQDVRAGSFNATAISVEWKPPAIGVGEGPIQGYHIVYWLRLSDCKSQAASKDRLRSSQRLTLFGNTLTSGIIIGLEADHYYCIGVQMFNTAGDSLESSFVDQTTFKFPPQNFPTIIRLNSTNTPNQIRVTWNGVRVMPEEESVDGYRIRYWESGAPVRMALDVDVGLKVTGLINNLHYDVRYNMRVFAYSRGGHGKLSNPMDQFMLVPRSRCQNDKIIEGPDVRYIFICGGQHQTNSIILLIVGLLVARIVV